MFGGLASSRYQVEQWRLVAGGVGVLLLMLLLALVFLGYQAALQPDLEAKYTAHEPLPALRAFFAAIGAESLTRASVTPGLPTEITAAVAATTDAFDAAVAALRSAGMPAARTAALSALLAAYHGASAGAPGDIIDAHLQLTAAVAAEQYALVRGSLGARALAALDHLSMLGVSANVAATTARVSTMQRILLLGQASPAGPIVGLGAAVARLEEALRFAPPGVASLVDATQLVAVSNDVSRTSFVPNPAVTTAGGGASNVADAAALALAELRGYLLDTADAAQPRDARSAGILRVALFAAAAATTLLALVATAVVVYRYGADTRRAKALVEAFGDATATRDLIAAYRPVLQLFRLAGGVAWGAAASATATTTASNAEANVANSAVGATAADVYGGGKRNDGKDKKKKKRNPREAAAASARSGAGYTVLGASVTGMLTSNASSGGQLSSTSAPGAAFGGGGGGAGSTTVVALGGSVAPRNEVEQQYYAAARVVQMLRPLVPQALFGELSAHHRRLANGAWSLLAQPLRVEMGLAQCRVTVMTVGINSATVQHATKERVGAVLAEAATVLAVVADEVHACGGIITSFNPGGRIVCVWNATNLVENAALAAVRAARLIDRRLNALAIAHELNIATGAAIVANTKLCARKHVTFISGAFEVADRLMLLNEGHLSRILLDQETHRELPRDHQRRCRPVAVLSERDEMSVVVLSADEESVLLGEQWKQYNTAFTLYQNGMLAEALGEFRRYCAAFPGDAIASWLVENAIEPKLGRWRSVKDLYGASTHSTKW